MTMLKSQTYTRRRILVAVLGVLLLVELFQLFWPSDRFYPLATLDGYSVSGQSVDHATEKLNEAASSRQIVLTDESTKAQVTLSVHDAGITTDYSARAGRAAHHSFLKRIVPFSWLFAHNTTTDSLPAAFSTNADPSAANVTAEVRNAGLEVKDGVLTTVAAVPGYTFQASDALAAAGSSLQSAASDKPAQATLNLRIAQPTVATETAERLRATVAAALGNQVTFSYGDGTWTVPAADVAGTLTVKPNGEDNTKLDASVDSSKLADLLKSKNVAIEVVKKAVETKAVPAVFATDDRASRAIDTTKTAGDLTAMLLGGKAQPVAVTTRTITNAALYENLPTEGSLEDKLKQLFGNATYEVAVVDLKTGESKLNINGDGVMTTASTYKLYIAYSMINAVESGKLTWNSPLNGTTLNTCLTRMIVNSDNACPEAWLRTYGFSTLTNQAHQIGAKNTNFKLADIRTTPNDLATVLKGYYDNTIATKASTDKLFQLMQTQVYREGIPTGIGSDGVVQDKVGFMNALLHDAAIVRCDKGDYAMVIMTEHASWLKIAQASLLIYDAL